MGFERLLGRPIRLHVARTRLDFSPIVAVQQVIKVCVRDGMANVSLDFRP
jgi:hypothetical protein